MKEAIAIYAKTNPGFVSPKVGTGYGGYAMYGNISKTGGYLAGYPGCHQGVTGSSNHAGVINWVRDYHPLWFKYVTDPNFSPWRKQFTDMVVFEGGWIVTDVENNTTQFIQNFAKCGRIWTEKPMCGNVCWYLLDAGVHPCIAILVSQFMSAPTRQAGCQLRKQSNYGWHGSFVNCDVQGLGSLAKMLAGDYTFDKLDEMYNVPSFYQGTDARWNATDKVNIIDHLKDRYSDCFEPPKAVAGRFATVTTGGMCNAALAAACLRLQKDLKLEPYV